MSLATNIGNRLFSDACPSRRVLALFVAKLCTLPLDDDFRYEMNGTSPPKEIDREQTHECRGDAEKRGADTRRRRSRPADDGRSVLRLPNSRAATTWERARFRDSWPDGASLRDTTASASLSYYDEESTVTQYLFIDGAFFERLFSEILTNVFPEENLFTAIDLKKITREYDRAFYYDALQARKTSEREADWQARREQKDELFNTLSLSPNIHVRSGISGYRKKRGLE